MVTATVVVIVVDDVAAAAAAVMGTTSVFKVAVEAGEDGVLVVTNVSLVTAQRNLGAKHLSAGVTAELTVLC